MLRGMITFPVIEILIHWDISMILHETIIRMSIRLLLAEYLGVRWKSCCKILYSLEEDLNTLPHHLNWLHPDAMRPDRLSFSFPFFPYILFLLLLFNFSFTFSFLSFFISFTLCIIFHHTYHRSILLHLDLMIPGSYCIWCSKS